MSYEESVRAYLKTHVPDTRIAELEAALAQASAEAESERRAREAMEAKLDAIYRYIDLHPVHTWELDYIQTLARRAEGGKG